MGKIIIEAADASELRKIMADLFGSTAAAGSTPVFPAFTVQTNTGAPAPQTETDEPDDTSPVNVNAPPIDSAGLPWDGRIHASSKAINESDGKWRMQRGIEKKLGAPAIAQIEAELRARVSGATQQPVAMPAPVQTPQPMTAAPGMPDMSQYQQPQQMQPAPMQQPVAMPAPVQTPQPTPAPAPVATGAMPFNEFMSYVGRAFQTPRADGQGMLIDQGYLAQLQAVLGVNNIGEIQNDPGKINQAIMQLRADGRWLGQ